MKNHIVFKFIAVLLCAVTLAGAVGGVLGVVLLTSGDLYDRTVEEMVDQQIHDDSVGLADWLAKNYASTELGGASEGMVQAHYGDHWYTNKYHPAHYGYRILDAEGNELLSQNPELAEQTDLYYREAFPVSGKYLHVVSAQTESQQRSREAERHGQELYLEGSTGTIPAEGVIVHHAFFANDNMPVLETYYTGGETVLSTYRESGAYDTTMLDTDVVGFLFYSPEGYLTFHSFFNYYDHAEWFPETVITEASFFFDDSGESLRLDDNGAGVGTLYLAENGHVIFQSQQALAEKAPEEAVSETTEATVPETTEATVPATTEVTVPETTEVTEVTEATEGTEAVEETVPSDASAVPEETAAITLAEETISTEPIPVDSLPAETVAETLPPETVPAETLPEKTGPTIINGKPLEEYQINTQSYYDYEQGETVHAQFVYVPMPELTVEVYMTEEALNYRGGYAALELLRTFRNYLLPMAGICLLVFAIFAVYLCTAAGRKPKCDEVRAGGLNRLPLDLYLFGGGFGVAGLIVLGEALMEEVFAQDLWAGCGMLAAIGILSALLMVGFLFAFVAQLKTPGGFWWRNTLCGHSIRLFFKFAMWLEDFLSHKGLPFCGKLLKRFWQFTMKTFVWLYKVTEKTMLWLGDKLKRIFGWLWKGLNRFMKLLPVTWQWLLYGACMIFFTMLAFQFANEFAIFCCLMVPVIIILYVAHCYGTLAESTRRMGKGDLNTKVDDKLMVGCFKDSAADLNALADVAVVAAQKQLKSERMKTELITNVSHDIKTPLTSIINYVDLLQKPHTEEEGEQYLEVLDRQSQRLKKLIDDLMDMSKANTGNMQVEITTVDAVESVNQALGEFSDKLDRAQLTPLFRHTEDRMPMRADGRLVWRVLSNLLGNAVKYAMPGTRLYIDLMQLEGKVIISLKNISREELNINAEELMERFVRGDESRNTEGSGLGLNIARSLMELQKGQLQLLVDGDLFKVTLIFPGVE
ncbi:MAG: hypothetical protein J6J12_00065 [Oscillospiraceae bacterium]|nr:hypothetical protein [Oscillospiraceae bacterium]